MTEALFPDYFEVEHVLPENWGGLTFPGNLALACSACNDTKRTTLGLLHPQTRLPVWLFHPRIDSWDAEFTLNLESGEIKGRTEKWRVTAECLGMNLDKPRAARSLWIALGVYP